MQQACATQEENFESFWKEVILKKFPKARIKTKDQSKLMRFLGLFSRSFYRNLTTVIGNTIYFPAKQDYRTWSGLRTLAHEFVHMVDRKNLPFCVFELQYLFPQILAIFSLFSILAFYNIWFIGFFIFLAFLIPGIPSKTRTNLEANAYTMTIFMTYQGMSWWNYMVHRTALSIADELAGKNYYFACRDRQALANMLKNRYDVLSRTHEAFKEVRKWLEA